jgi:hypothetical protein
MDQRTYNRNYILYTSQEGIKAHVLRITYSLQYTKSFPGILSQHKFMPIDTSEIKMYFFPSDKEVMCTEVSATGLTSVAMQTSQLCPRKLVAAAYDSVWYIR